jgi:hypothetical protein
MAQPVWVTTAGDLGTIAENLFFQLSVLATDPDGGTPTYSLIAGRLPEGVQVLTNGTVEGVPQAYVSVKGTPTEVSENVTSTFAIRATSPDGLSINDRTFSLTVTGQDIPQFTTAAGSLGTFYDCNNVNITIGFTDTDPNDTVIISVDNGELPPGLVLDPNTGLISGHISAISNLPNDATSGYDASAFDLYPFDFATRAINKNYEFTLKISDGKDQNLRTFTMFVVSRDSLTADTTDFTADSEILTADLSPSRTPYITNYPAAQTDPVVAVGTIGTFRHNNFFAYQILGFDCDGSAFEFEIVMGDSADLPPGIAFDRTTGWLTGYFPDQGATETTYTFDITIYKAGDNSVVSSPYTYRITVIGSIESSVIWSNGTLVPGTGTGTAVEACYTLGTIDNGETSMLSIIATNPSGRVLLFKLDQGAGKYNLLPQGLQLLESGNISGRVSFNTFTFDSGTTTFDKDVTTRLISAETLFDKNFDFTVVAYSSDGLVAISRKFRITVDRKYSSPYNGLYMKAMPDKNDRAFVDSLLQNTDILEPSSIYRADDPYFGIASSVIYNHAYSLDTGSLDEYLHALSKNHFRKKLILGDIQTAQALNDDGTVAYEVVYSNVVDTGVNSAGESPPQSITLPYPVTIEGATYNQIEVEFQEPQQFENRFRKLEQGELHTLADRTFLFPFPKWRVPHYPLATYAADNPSWHQQAKDLSLLTTVAAQMAARWDENGMPSNPAGNKVDSSFTFTPENLCTWTKNEHAVFEKFFPGGEYDNDKVIYCEYLFGKYMGPYTDKKGVFHPDDVPKNNPNGIKIGDPKYHVAPYALFCEPDGEDYCYVSVRGTLNGPDGGLDIQANLLPSPFGANEDIYGKVAQGFNKAFIGLGTGLVDRPNTGRAYTIPGQTLIDALNNTTRTKIRIGGHSLGGAVATSVTALAATLDKFTHIESYPTAGPQMGNDDYYKWFQTLKEKNGVVGSVNEKFTRIINRRDNGQWNDNIPRLPGYQPVGKAINFDARYTKPNDNGKINVDGGANHQICGAYAFAIRHPSPTAEYPDAPFNNLNQWPNVTKFPVKPKTSDFDLTEHILQRNAKFYEGTGGTEVVVTGTQDITTIYPNSLVNMRDRVVDTVGQTNTVLPLWMTSKQADGRVLGFTKAWIIAYTNPGEADRISYNIRTKFGEILNKVDFISDRYILDNQLTHNWVINEDSIDGGSFAPSPPLTTTFNANQTTNPTSSSKETTFDGNSLRFTSPVDVYGKTDKYDKYFVYPATTILGSADATNTIVPKSSTVVTIDQSLADYEGPYYIFGTSNSGFTDTTNGYFYPLYLNRTYADAADTGTGSTTLGNGTSHVHTFTEFPGINFYMPNSSMNHGEAIKPDLPVYTYSGDLGPMATVGEDTTPSTPSLPTPSVPTTPSYSGGTGGGGGSSGGGGYGSSSSSSSSSSSGYSYSGY